MRALVLERKDTLSLRDIDLPLTMSPDSVKIRIHTVGICGSDVHYYTHGGAGPRLVTSPMVLGHEASGTVVEVGMDVRTLKVGDRVCMEPGVPNMQSKSVLLGKYNVDPDVAFWATPPVHGCLTEFVVHPAAFTFKLPDAVSFAEAAMVEPFAVGMHAVAKARVNAGDVAVVLGAGPIGVMIALAALAGGCSRVFITDLHQPKLDIAAQYESIAPINVRDQDAAEVLRQATDGWGADIVFEASGAPKAIASATELACPGGKIVFVGVPVEDHRFDIAGAINKELRIETIFRYANVFERALKLIASGKVDLKPLVSETFEFEDSVKAFERARSGLPNDLKLQIRMPLAPEHNG